MKFWQWALLISITTTFLTLLAANFFLPLDWSLTPMMGRGHGHWNGLYNFWGMSWLFVGMRILYWLLPVLVIALTTTLFLNSQRRHTAPEPVDTD